MPPDTDIRPSTPPRRAAVDIIDAVLENLRNNLEPLKYTVLVPSRFLVYLHPAEHARIEGIVPILEKETVRALTEELARLNRRPGWRRHVDRFLGPAPELQNAAMEWHVEFLRDPDGELNEGDILVDSELLLPPPPDLGAGDRTRRVTTRHFRQPDAPVAATAQRTATRVETIERPAGTTAPVHARLRYEDNSGVHSYDIARDSVTVGRGGLAYRVDVRVEASADVSREHLRIRRDPATNRFYVVDLSSLGTTVEGARVPKGYEEAEGSKRENGVEAPLPERARIGLADTVFIDFEVSRR
jgi:pSer/pThr/pTyr-binding forkhead associated (FHA) protein